jgi:hypothetical protein
MLYVPDEFTVAVNGPSLTPSGAVSVSVIVAPGVPLPTMLACVAPTIGLLGDNEPVRFAVAAFTVRLTVAAPRVNPPFFPSRMMLL